MTHYKIVRADQWDRLTERQTRRKHFANPVADAICIAVLAVILMLAYSMHP